jgi:hypothetical protein
MESFLQDLRFGMRMLRKNPTFTGVAQSAMPINQGLAISPQCVAHSVSE